MSWDYKCWQVWDYWYFKIAPKFKGKHGKIRSLREWEVSRIFVMYFIYFFWKKKSIMMTCNDVFIYKFIIFRLRKSHFIFLRFDFSDRVKFESNRFLWLSALDLHVRRKICLIKKLLNLDFYQQKRLLVRF